jgi:hypothetical protein
VPRFCFQEQAILPASAGDCVEAARRTLAEMGAQPVLTGARVSGKLGSQLKMRFVGGAFCPLKWLPIDVVRTAIYVRDAIGQRLAAGR